jgi:CBS domain-containing protein
MNDNSDEINLRKLRIRDVMVRDPVTIDSDMTVEETARAMARSKRGCLLVMSKGKITGIVTERDLVRKALSDGAQMLTERVATIMSSPLVVVNPDVTVEEAAKVMADNQVRRLPVVDKTEMVGIITVTDLAKALAKQLQSQARPKQCMDSLSTASGGLRRESRMIE